MSFCCHCLQIGLTMHILQDLGKEILKLFAFLLRQHCRRDNVKAQSPRQSRKPASSSTSGLSLNTQSSEQMKTRKQPDGMLISFHTPGHRDTLRHYLSHAHKDTNKTTDTHTHTHHRALRRTHIRLVSAFVCPLSSRLCPVTLTYIHTQARILITFVSHMFTHPLWVLRLFYAKGRYLQRFRKYKQD